MSKKTLIIRHRRENLKKCSLRGLESAPDLLFFPYPFKNLSLPDLSSYFLLDFEGEPLTAADADHGLLLLDGTWRYAQTMMRDLPPLPRRSLPSSFKTAYPRRQTECPLPERGLATVEALYIAHAILGKPRAHLLQNYYWKEAFLKTNHLLESAHGI